KVQVLRGQLENLRTRLRQAELAVSLERQSSGEPSRRAALTLEFLNSQVAEVEAEMAAQAQVAGNVDARATEPARPLEAQMRALDVQLEALTRQQTALARQQEALVDAQREIASQLQRVREVLEQLRRSGERRD